ncbi:hypothetical protein CRE_21004 [Caenorhabditis remanei]|uniref:Uncharacterized protein n=1 Tax=Caenorhabditis remanei TaxID=31234 RepID=E3NKG7_CAERE|nr:hypothetical protein CRE_21004 [Caenorhabditis remanei]
METRHLRIELSILEKLRRGSTRLRENIALTALGADRLMELVTMLDRNIRDAISAGNTRLLVPCNDEIDIFEEEICEERATDATVIALNMIGLDTSSTRSFDLPGFG